MNQKLLLITMFSIMIYENTFSENSPAIEDNNLFDSEFETSESSSEETKISKPKHPQYKFFLGPAFAVFHSQDNLYKELHQQETFVPMLQFQIQMKTPFSIWSDLAFFYNKGRLSDPPNFQANTKAKVYHLMFGTGLKMRRYFHNDANIFVKAGPSFMGIRAKQYFPRMPRKVDKLGLGVTVGCGIEAHMKNNWNLNLFADYLFIKKSIRHPGYSEKVDLGGLLAGLGLQYKF